MATRKRSSAAGFTKALPRPHRPGLRAPAGGRLGSVTPVQFIPVAEECGLIVPIGRWDPELLVDIERALQTTGLAPEMLELEVTESMVMHDVERAIKVLSGISAFGVRLALDDFGTGYSSLAQLKRFPIDTLKVDRSFIREIPNDSEDRAITQAIIAMGRTLSLTVIAEGVETEEQEAFLRSNACDQMQGFYFSKPIAAEQFAELLATYVPKPLAG